MKKTLRLVLLGTLTLILLVACTGQEGSPTAAGTTVPGDETASPPPIGTDTTATAATDPAGPVDTTATIDTATIPADSTPTTGTDVTQTPGVPVTGADLVLLEGQFCIEDMAHALLVLPDTATFETVTDTASLSTPGPDTGCHVVDLYNGRQIVLCRSAENTSLNLNICTDGNNCTQLLVEPQDCPAVVQLGVTDTPGAGLPTNTPEAGFATATAGVGVTDTPAVGGSPTATP